MAEEQEPQYLTLKERIAALKQQQASDAAAPSSNKALTMVAGAGKRPPPPPAPKPSISDRPLNNLRTQSAPNGSALSTTIGNMPARDVAPPPILDREIKVDPRNLKLSERGLRKPPPLPGRKVSTPIGATSPSLPQRKPSDQLTVASVMRKPSNESLKSTYSNHSTYSYGGTRSSASSVNTEHMRRLPPALGEADLPKLPPSKRELEEKSKLEKAPRDALRTSKSTSAVPRITRHEAPPMPALPSRPSLPSRPTPSLPSRPLPPPRPDNSDNAAAVPPMPIRPRVNHGITGFSHGVETPPSKPQRPIQSSHPSNYAPPALAGPAVIDLTPATFDSVVMSGKPALVFFHLPYCQYCKPVFPIYDELGTSYQHARNQFSICKVDGAEHKSLNERFGVEGWPTIMWFDGRGGEPDTFDLQRDLESLTRFVKQKSGGLKPGPPMQADGGAPPPVPTSSRPSVSQIEAIRARQAQDLASRPAQSPVPLGSDKDNCLICRDYSSPDHIATLYPRSSIPSGSAAEYLAHHLCSPFPSHTDKARAIFTWCHHNIDYDFANFLAGNIKHQTPEEAIRSGFGVCEQYASIFAAIALKAGLECVQVSGHGKGYGHTEVGPGKPLPKYEAGHAWNAVRIDRGRWKLIDACWGAGHVGGGKYTREFKPRHFTDSNVAFGMSHFPEKPEFQHREDGRTIGWEEYLLGPPELRGEAVELMGCVDQKHNLSRGGFEPKVKHIPATPVRNVRFKFETACSHWDFHKNGSGEPYQFCLKIAKKPGMAYSEDLIPFDFDVNAGVWWLDVPTSKLGARGDDVMIYSIEKLEGQDARGLKKAEYLRRKEREGYMSEVVAKWVLV